MKIQEINACTQMIPDRNTAPIVYRQVVLDLLSNKHPTIPGKENKQRKQNAVMISSICSPMPLSSYHGKCVIQARPFWGPSCPLARSAQKQTGDLLSIYSAA